MNPKVGDIVLMDSNSRSVHCKNKLLYVTEINLLGLENRTIKAQYLSKEAASHQSAFAACYRGNAFSHNDFYVDVSHIKHIL
jgi:hypothetical protein